MAVMDELWPEGRWSTLLALTLLLPLGGCFVGLTGASTTLRLGAAASTATGAARAAGLANHLRVASLALANEARFAGLGVRSLALRERSGAAMAHARLAPGRVEIADGARLPLVTSRFEGGEIVHRAPRGTAIGRTRFNADRTRFDHVDAEERFLGHDEIIDGRRVRHYGPNGELVGESVLVGETGGPAVVAGAAGATSLLVAAVPEASCGVLKELWRACHRAGAGPEACEDFAMLGLDCLTRRLQPPEGIVPRVSPAPRIE